MNNDKRDTLRAGEKGFTLILLAAATFFLYKSALLWMEKPGVDGPAMIPLLSSGIVTLLSLLQVVRSLRKRTDKKPLEYLFSVNVLAAIGAIILLCVSLGLGVSFYIAAPAFLWGLMTFYAKGNYLKNLVWTAICIGFVYIAFDLLLNVKLP